MLYMATVLRLNLPGPGTGRILARDCDALPTGVVSDYERLLSALDAFTSMCLGRLGLPKFMGLTEAMG